MAEPISSIITTLQLQPSVYATYIREFEDGVKAPDFMDFKKYGDNIPVPSHSYGKTETGNNASGNTYVSKTDNFKITGWDSLGYYMNWGETVQGVNDADYTASGKLSYNYQNFEIPEGEVLQTGGVYDPYKYDKSLTSKFYINLPIIRFGATNRYDSLAYLLVASEDNRQIVKQFGEQAAAVQSQYTRATLINEATQHAGLTFTGAGITTAEGTNFKNAIEVIKATLKRTGARKIASDIKASDGVGTNPVRGGYIAIINSELEKYIQNIDGFKHYTEYGTQAGLLENEFGTIPALEIRFVTNNAIIRQSGVAGTTALTMADDWDNTNNRFNVFNMLIFGKNAYAFSTLDGAKAYQLFMDEPKDTLRLERNMGWKSYLGVKVKRPAWIYNIPITLSWA